MNEGPAFKIGDTPQSVTRELRAAYRSDAQRGWNIQEPSASVVLTKPCRCKGLEGVRLRAGIFCRKCGRSVS